MVLYLLSIALVALGVGLLLNVCTDQVARMAQIYSDLHQNIQDSFNEARVEICSPHFAKLRDGNSIAIPPEYIAKDYDAPRFRLEPRPASSGA